MMKKAEPKKKSAMTPEKSEKIKIPESENKPTPME
jgi:hypothetical protein